MIRRSPGSKIGKRPVGPFAIVELRDQEIGQFYQVRECVGTDLEARDII